MEHVTIDGINLSLANPVELSLKWVGQGELLKQLLAAWMVIDERDIPFNPRLIGKPGVGKTTLAYAAATVSTDRSTSSRQPWIPGRKT
nr:hypothetical protein [Geotalea toluenoxydans]